MSTPIGEVLERAASHLDFYASAYYTAVPPPSRRGAIRRRKTSASRIILEGWKDPGAARAGVGGGPGGHRCRQPARAIRDLSRLRVAGRRLVGAITTCTSSREGAADPPRGDPARAATRPERDGRPGHPPPHRLSPRPARTRLVGLGRGALAPSPSCTPCTAARRPTRNGSGCARTRTWARVRAAAPTRRPWTGATTWARSAPRTTGATCPGTTDNGRDGLPGRGAHAREPVGGLQGAAGVRRDRRPDPARLPVNGAPMGSVIVPEPARARSRSRCAARTRSTASSSCATAA